MECRCKLVMFVASPLGDAYASRWARLPFVPVVGMELIGYDNPEISQPEDDAGDRIVRVAWVACREYFLVVLQHTECCSDPPRTAEEIVRELYGAEWKVEPIRAACEEPTSG